MFEVGIAFLAFLYVLLLAWPGIEWQLAIGGALTLMGLFGGGSAGIVYHWRLRRALVRLGESTSGWMWAPVSRHSLLDERGQREVLPYFRVGAAGFFVCLAGIGVLAVALLRASVNGQ
ncbi:MAG: hypothetical protein ABSB49_17915 [Polyangia bacterium]